MVEKPSDKPRPTISSRSPLYRAVRKRELLTYINTATENNKILDVAQLLAVMSWKWGISMKTVNEYIEEFKVMGAIKVNSERVTITKIGKQLLSEAI